MIINGEKYITEKEVASKYDLPLGWIKRLRYYSNLPYHKLHRKVYLKDKEVEEWLKSNLESV